MTVGLAAICSPVDKKYLDEWTIYNRKIGFDHIFVFTNNFETKLRCSDVTTQRIDGFGLQRAAYMSALLQLHQKFDWLAFLDIDEFIYPGDSFKDLPEMLQGFKDTQCLGLNWFLFGDNGLHFNGDHSVLRRFTMRQNTNNRHIKSLLNMKKIDVDRVQIQTPHNFIGVQQVDVHKRPFTGPWNLNPISPADPFIGHFFCKTREEWELKRQYGKADHPEWSPDRFRKDEEFDAHNFNEVFDDRLKRILHKEESWTA